MHKFTSYHKLEQQFFSLLSFEKIDLGCLTAFATGVKAPNLNPAIVNSVKPLLENHLLTCECFYLQKNLPWALILPDYLLTADSSTLLDAQKLSLVDKGVAMELDLKSYVSIPLELEIKEMKHELETWSIPILYGFESTPAITSIYTKQHQSAVYVNDNIYHFSGFVENNPICSLTLTIDENSARLDDIATLPAYQKRGYATKLIHAALRHATNLGIKTCFLEASALGLNVYKRIGFQPLFSNLYYEKESKLT
ncbi:GNAT family acetyltransferase [Legionella busanensis]|uniref:GNAT family acetyltransferase n=1 Tax=Legionella busanensis TaxID=190655 RepID=A0A378JL56_9GAMM|nr:GNAT family N-acetyltransferase [Legionella busanensis]STX50949.1 GNAT family acetyltransferase [Legionella busanensis]